MKVEEKEWKKYKNSKQILSRKWKIWMSYIFLNKTFCVPWLNKIVDRVLITMYLSIWVNNISIAYLQVLIFFLHRMAKRQ